MKMTEVPPPSPGSYIHAIAAIYIHIAAIKCDFFSKRVFYIGAPYLSQNNLKIQTIVAFILRQVFPLCQESGDKGQNKDADKNVTLVDIMYSS